MPWHQNFVVSRRVRYISSVLDGVNRTSIVFPSSLLSPPPPPWLLDPGLGPGLVEVGLLGPGLVEVGGHPGVLPPRTPSSYFLTPC